MSQNNHFSFRKIISFLGENYTQIFLISFLILFLELSLIRWLGSEIISLSFFSNTILMASFFGIGVGCVFCQKKNIFGFFPFLLLLSCLLIFLNLYIKLNDNDIVFFQGSSSKSIIINHEYIIAFIFIYVVLFFAILGQRLGCEFIKCKKSIDAYIFDLLGSISGVVLFALLSHLEIGVNVWISIVAVLWLIIALINTDIKLKFDKNGNSKIFIIILAFFLINTEPYINKNMFWSKYYKIIIEEYYNGFFLYVNKTGHQILEKETRPESKEMYDIPYQLFDNPQYENVLIIGAGMGNDVMFALKNGVKNIDAVEIDQKIIELGKKYNNHRTYFDSRVNVVINDGRNFIEQTSKKYDLIIFALTDSLTLSSNVANTRLESYLFTQDSLQKVKNLLNENGLVILYNFYRKDWIVEKIAGMLENAFDKESIILKKSHYNAILNGNKIKDFNPKQNYGYRNEFTSIKNSENNLFPTDDWPFLYLIKPMIPVSYQKIIFFQIAVVALFLLFLFKETKKTNNIPFDMMFLGIGFMLLETKNIVNFQLLFGSTWGVNLLVFLAILISALIAALIIKNNIKIKIQYLYFLMLFTLVISLLVPLKSFIEFPSILKYILASIVSFSPILVANLIFSQTFSGEKKSALCFGLNMVGAMIGGMLESSAMLIGYHNILYIVSVCYLLAITNNFYRYKKFR